jgi:hypothetical protein
MRIFRGITPTSLALALAFLGIAFALVGLGVPAVGIPISPVVGGALLVLAVPFFCTAVGVLFIGARNTRKRIATRDLLIEAYNEGTQFRTAYDEGSVIDWVNRTHRLIEERLDSHAANRFLGDEGFSPVSLKASGWNGYAREKLLQNRLERLGRLIEEVRLGLN